MFHNRGGPKKLGLALALLPAIICSACGHPWRGLSAPPALRSAGSDKHTQAPVQHTHVVTHAQSHDVHVFAHARTHVSGCILLHAEGTGSAMGCSVGGRRHEAGASLRKGGVQGCWAVCLCGCVQAVCARTGPGIRSTRVLQPSCLGNVGHTHPEWTQHTTPQEGWGLPPAFPGLHRGHFLER